MTDKSFNELRVDAYHAANRAAELGLTAQDIAQMPWDEYSRLMGNPDRPTPAQAGLSAFYAQEEPEKASNPAPPGPNQPQTYDSSPHAQRPLQAPPGPAQGIDVGSMDMEQYGQLRAQLGIGQGSEYGRGLTNAPSRSWQEAAAAKSGRSAMVTSGVEEPLKPARVFVNERANPISGRRTFYRGA